MFVLSLLVALIPIIFGIIIYFVKLDNRKVSRLLSLLPIVLGLIINIVICFNKSEDPLVLFQITKDLKLVAKIDTISKFFSIIISIIFTIVTIYSFEYFKEDEKKNHFDAFFILAYGALMLLCYSGNLITMYISFEMVTLLTMPLVLHDKTKESIDAALKYLLYSIGGAFLGFIGVVYLSLHTTEAFVFGGSLDSSALNSKVFYCITLLMLIGFGTKCGLFPLHNWLPTAHPVAPAPASAILSGIITKSGVLAIIRIVYYTIGTDALYGTWVHYTWIILILITILLGSLMAVVQKNMKKRLAFSSVSQISYVLLGLAMFTKDSFSGALMQFASHATIKVGLFLVAGVLIHHLHIHDVDEMDGIGKRMPITMWCYTICSLGLIGVPPTSGFVAKWYLVTGSLSSGLRIVYVVAPIVLIISAILTAYYLLQLTVSAFFPSNKEVEYKGEKEPVLFIIPLIILATLTVLIGVFSFNIVSIIQSIFM